MNNTEQFSSSKPIFVLGMHRSGTSMLTRAINSIGVSIGQKDALMVTLPDQNAIGFWEIQQLTDLNDALLKRMGGIWHTPPFVSFNSLQSADFKDLAAKASRSLARVYQTNQWVWKDPRNCVTFPFWKPLLPHKQTFIYIYRNPLNVWKSLEKRDGFPKRKAFDLWEIYNFSALQNMAGAFVYTVNYDRFLDSPLQTLGQIERFLGWAGFKDLTVPNKEETHRLVRGNLRHWSQTDEDFIQDDYASSSQIELYQALLETHGAVDEFQTPVIPGWPESVYTPWTRQHHAYTSELMTEVAALTEKVGQRGSALHDQVSNKNIAFTSPDPPRSSSSFIGEKAAGDPGMAETAFFTIVSKNYLAYARVLCNSILKFHPNANIYVLLVDRLDNEFDPEQEPYQLVLLDDLDNIPNPEHLFFKYTVLELNTAVKPFFFGHLMEKFGYRKIIYFDPDIMLFNPLNDLLNMLDIHAMVLTPHITQPYQDNLKPNEIDINLAGIYNLGFLGISDTPSMRKFIKWWQSRLYDFCALDMSRGLFVDQLWVNFAPTMFEGVSILRDLTYNIAYWNLHYRGPGLQFKNEQLLLEDKPVVFFHFSGFNPNDLERISKHQNRFTLTNLPNLRPLFEFYRDALIAAGHNQSRNWKYELNYFDNGVRIPDIIRVAYRNMGGGALFFGDPFATNGFANYLDWLNKNLNASDKLETLPIKNVLAQIYALSPYLQRTFPNPIHKDNRHLLEWMKENGAEHFQLDPIFLSNMQNKKAKHRRHHKNRAREKSLPYGVNIAGFLTGEFGIGQNARVNTKAIQSAGIPYVLNNISYTAHRTQDDTFKNFSKDNPYAINLIHVGADSTPTFRQIVGQDFFKDRYNIGVWWWELEQFPERWASSFSLYQEIWTQSTFCQRSISRRSPIPVKMIPNVVHIDEELIQVDRPRFNIPADVFSFIFNFDFASEIERKNPFAVIEAFRQAFGNQTDVLLILKSINDHIAPHQMRSMRETTGDINIRFINEHLSRRNIISLITTADCYVSLHRSEGFGQGMAEAMFVGTPVIATGYSGNMDFMTPENSYPVDFELVELTENYGPYKKGNRWAEPSVEHTAGLMKRVYNQRAEAHQKAKQAAADIRKNHSFEALGEKMVARFEAIDRLTNRKSIPVRASKSTRPESQDHLVDIIIPVYGEPDLLKRCVESVLETTTNARLFLIDDCSPGSEIQAIIRQWDGHPRVSLLQTPSNQGFIGATRLGASIGKAPYILFLNSDTEAIDPGWLEKLIPSDDQVGIVGARLIYPPNTPGPLGGTIQHAGVGRNAKGIPYHPFLGWPADAPEANIPREVNAITGACFLVRREIWDQLGGWDAQFGLGVYEDVDFCWRARQAGYQVRYETEVSLYHHASASRGLDGIHLLNQHTMDNLKRLLEKWGPQESDEALFYGVETYQRWEKARIKLKQGLQLQSQKDAPDALRWFDKAVEIAPDFAEAHLILGQTLGELGQYQEAADHLQKAIAFAPANWDARLLLVDAWIKVGEADRALIELDKLLDVFPHHPELQARRTALAPKSNSSNGAQNPHAYSHAAVKALENLLAAEDLPAALVQNEEQLDVELLQLIEINASTARTDGDVALAEGLEALAAYVNDVIVERQAPVPSNGNPPNVTPVPQSVHEASTTGPKPAAAGRMDPLAPRQRKKRRRRRRKP